jgi:hypothetical protein
MALLKRCMQNNRICFGLFWIGLLTKMTIYPGIAAGVPVSGSLAEQVATRFLSHVDVAHTIGSVESAQYEGRQVGFLFHLCPQGYILVAGDDIRVPVKGYSLRSKFTDLPDAYRQNLLYELDIPLSPTVQTFSAISSGEINAPYWNFLTQDEKQTVKSPFIAFSYIPDTFLED